MSRVQHCSPEHHAAPGDAGTPLPSSLRVTEPGAGLQTPRCHAWAGGLSSRGHGEGPAAACAASSRATAAASANGIADRSPATSRASGCHGTATPRPLSSTQRLPRQQSPFSSGGFAPAAAPGPFQDISSDDRRATADSKRGEGGRPRPRCRPAVWGPGVLPRATSHRQTQPRSHRRGVPSAGDAQHREPSRGKRYSDVSELV